MLYHLFIKWKRGFLFEKKYGIITTLLLSTQLFSPISVLASTDTIDIDQNTSNVETKNKIDENSTFNNKKDLIPVTNDNSNVSDLQNDTTSEVDELIQVPDGWLRNIIQRELPGIHPTNKDNFKKSELEKLTTLGTNARDAVKNVKDLTGLEYATNLVKLDFGQAPLISDITPLKNTTKLEEFDISENKLITDLTPLKNNNNLKTLKIKFTNINSLSPISSGLNNLFVDYTTIPTSELLKFSKLKHLGYSGHKNVSAEDIKNIATLHDLYNLELAEDNLQDGMVALLAPLKLTFFSAPYNNFSSLAGFDKLDYSNMEGLGVIGNHIMGMSVFSPMMKKGCIRPINAMQQTFAYDKQISSNNTIIVKNPVKDYLGSSEKPIKISPNDNSITYDQLTDTIVIAGKPGTSGKAKISYSYARSYVTYDAQIDIPYEFKAPLPAKKVTVHYQDVNGKKIAEDQILSGNIGDTYKSDQINIDGYTFKKVIGDASGIFKDLEQEVTYIYSKDSIKANDIIVHYQDVNGERITDDKVLSGNIGENYILDNSDIINNGITYHYVSAQPNILAGKFGDIDQPSLVTLTYNINHQVIKGSNFSMYIGDDKPTVDSFKASAKDKDGKDSAITLDLSKVDYTKAGVYDVGLNAADGQSKSVQLTILANTANFGKQDSTSVPDNSSDCE